MCTTRFGCPGGIFGTLFWAVLTVQPSKAGAPCIFDVLLAVCITENALVKLETKLRRALLGLEKRLRYPGRSHRIARARDVRLQRVES